MPKILLPNLVARNVLYNDYKKSAKRRKLKFDLSVDIFTEITSSNCVYCGIEPKQIVYSTRRNGQYIYNGIDRVNNNLGYIVGNCISCCKICNFAKGRMTTMEFYEWVTRVYNYNRIIGVPL